LPAVALSLAFTTIVLFWDPHVRDLAAQTFRTELFEHGGFAIWNGSWYGVGRLNYSMLERRIADAIVGVEYDAGCWIGRVVATRQSTGLTEATTRLLFQLELVGLSRLGSNPLQLLKDNIPGYKLLREGSGVAPLSSAYD